MGTIQEAGSIEVVNRNTSLGAVHGRANSGKLPLELTQVAVASHVVEDGIVCL